MAFHCMKMLQTIRSVGVLRYNMCSISVAGKKTEKVEPKEYRTEDNLVFFEDPDTFGTLSRRLNRDKVILEDEGDLKEEKHIKNNPLPHQQLTTKQYADIIKQYLGHKRLKEAINVLEVRMLKEDRVKPENYIYNILIGACADVGYTKKAFSLFNDMKKRALKPTGDTYTCLFHACSNSPFILDGQKKASHLRELMNEKGIEPNLTNYNAMIKAFGRCGDLTTAFKIVDEMVEKGIKIRVHTFNHLLQACISDKENGLRHALIVWRKMLKMREKPNIYSFNLMLKCVKECNMGSKTDIEELILVIQDQMDNKKRVLQLEQSKPKLAIQGQDKTNTEDMIKQNFKDQFEVLADLQPIEKKIDFPKTEPDTGESADLSTQSDSQDITECTQLTVSNNTSVQLVKLNRPQEVRKVPNLLSKELKLQQVLSLQKVVTLQDKFAVIGGQEDFLKEMNVYEVKPDIKTFTQMLALLDETNEAEIKLLDTLKTSGLKADIDFYNMLIKKRCLRLDYDAAFKVKEIIKTESMWRKKKFPLKKKFRLKTNIMTYGVLAMACKTKENAIELLSEMKEAQLKVNIEILGTLLRQGTSNYDFGYILYMMKVVKQENIQVNSIMLKHLEVFKEQCYKSVKSKKREKDDVFLKSYTIFSKAYNDWLQEINAEEALKPEHPWAQFNNTYPETIQRQHFQIEEPKKFYKRNRKHIKYVPTV